MKRLKEATQVIIKGFIILLYQIDQNLFTDWLDLLGIFGIQCFKFFIYYKFQYPIR